MPIPWTRALGLSLIACLVAVMAAPALAADPAHGRAAFPVSRGTGLANLHARGMNLISSLQLMGNPITGPFALAIFAERAVQRFIPFSPAEKPAVLGNIGKFNRTVAPAYAPGGVQATTTISLAENLTAYLAGKGYDVADMNAALSRARTAIAGSNQTAFREAMAGFRTDLNAKIAAGTINRTAIGDYLKTLQPARTPVSAGWGTRARGMRITAHRGW
ncbi:MAG TPA: hypothetical protein VMS81_02895 [Methanomicrobiales archaeon]|nr:hypothetical protein [Methanomicrobiales archaeon]